METERRRAARANPSEEVADRQKGRQLAHSEERELEQAIESLCAGRDREASLRILFLAFYDSLFGFFRRRGVSQEEAEDLVQECFISVERSIVSYRRQAPFKYWLFGLALNTYRGAVRRAVSRRRGVTEISLEFVDENQATPAGQTPEESPLDVALQEERRQQLRSAAEHMAPQMRQCILLSVAGYENREIAAILGIQASTVRVQLFRARNVLRQRLVGEPDLEGPSLGDST